MIHWLTAPKSAELAKYIDCYWYLDKPAGGVENPKLNPDPSAHLILALPTQPYQYALKEGVYGGAGSHWLYPYNQTLELDHANAFACIGVKFKVGALYSLKEVSFSQPLVNTIVPLDIEVFNGSLNLYECELLSYAKNTPDKCVERLDALFSLVIANCNEDKHSEVTRKALNLLGDKPINELGEMLFCSQRTLERSFNRVTGFTLKQCQAMNKLEAILEYLYQREQSDIDWVDIAYQFGFSDQPHLIRYLKQQINLTPKHYTQQRGFTIDLYGGVSSD